MDESFLLEQLMRSIGESYESQDSVAKGAAADDTDNMLAQLAIQVHLAVCSIIVMFSFNPL